MMMLAVTVLLENSRCSPATASTMTKGRSASGTDGDLTEQNPGEPACRAAVVDGEAQRQPGHDHHQAAPLDARFGFLPREHADAGQEERDPAGEPDGFDGQRDAPAGPILEQWPGQPEDDQDHKDQERAALGGLQRTEIAETRVDGFGR